jgi:hypothetical protein
MQKINVKKVECKPGKTGVLVIVHDDKDAKFSAFTNKVPDLDKVIAGDVIEAEIQIDGKYANIISFKLLEHGTAPALSADTGTTKNDKTERDSYEAQTAFKGIIELFTGNNFWQGSPIEDEVYQSARVAIDWAVNKLGGELKTEPIKREPVVHAVKPLPNTPDKQQDGQETGDKPLPIDWDWLTETMGIIHWTPKSAISHLQNVIKADVVKDDLKATVKKLSKEKAETFVKKLNEMREAAGKQ